MIYDGTGRLRLILKDLISIDIRQKPIKTEHIALIPEQ